MNNFENFINDAKTGNEGLKDVNEKTEELLSIMERGENQERALIAATVSLFLKKRKNMQDMINESKGMDMFLSVIKEAAGDKIPSDLPDNSKMIKQGEEVIAAIDNLIEAIQKYGAATAKFNDVVRTDVAARNEYQKRLNESESKPEDDEPHSGRYPWGDSLGE